MATTPLKRPGIQSKLSRKTGIPHSTISCIFSGKRRATPEQAALLEPLLQNMGFQVTAWSMSSCPRGTKLMDLIEKRKEE